MKTLKTTILTLTGALGLWALAAAPAAADFVIADDLIVQGSACIGFDCVNNENFGFDTIRLKENNLRIRFDDTSTVSGFPPNDWQLIANDSQSGGASKFSIEDSSAGRTVFTIRAGAPSNAMFVDSAGRLGLNTGTPALSLHVRSGNTPALRLEQDNSSGFTPQTWDLAGNEASIFIRDATNGSRLPFRIRPNAPSSSIDIAGTSGNVGVGTSAPGTSLHVRRTDATAQLRVEEASTTVAIRTLMDLRNNGGVRFDLTNTSVVGNKIWRIGMNDAGTSMTINPVGSGNVYTFLDNGNMTVPGTLTTSGPTCGPPAPPCDLVFSPDYPLESIEEHAAAMWSRGHLPAVGPTAKDLPFNVTEKTGRMLNELEKAHIYIEQLHSRLQTLEARLQQLETAGAQ